MDAISIGLDIGSSAVRAAEIEVKEGRRLLRRYAQVGLPHGYVVDGEVVNLIGVAEAIRRLWAEGGFSSTKVILGVSGPRVFVRQADVPAMNKDDIRSSLRFDSQELVPIPLEDSSFDVSILASPGATTPIVQEPAEMRILLVAAHRDVLRSYLNLMKECGLEAVAMDSSALALMRAVPTGQVDTSDALEVVCSIGADLTTVAVRQQGNPKFIRTLTVGGSKLTSAIADSMHLELATAERLKRRAVPSGTAQVRQARKASGSDIRDLAEDVRATIDFFASQASGTEIERLLLTGGASLTEGLAAAIGGNLPVQIMQVAPFAGFDVSHCDLEPQDLEQASAGATTAIGLALWPHESPLIRLSILPEEVALARRARRVFQTAVLSVAALAGVLVVAGGAKVLEVRSAQHSAKAAQQQVLGLKAEVNHLESVTAVHGRMMSRAQLDQTALKGDVDWDRLLGQLATVMPANVEILTFSGSRTVSTSAASSSSTGNVGTVTFAVTGSGDAKTAAAWLQGLQRDPSFTGSWVSGISMTHTNGGQMVSFSSNANLTATAQSTRAEDAKP